ncbi:tetratricopeptide repeat protein [bacterium]|nr:tetratricopeptide repeat protein [bacterium]
MTFGVPSNYEFSEIERLRKLSVTDELTGLLNRRYFFKRLAQEISKSRRNKRPFSLLILDVDKFKEINDTYGHLEGDEVLRVIAQVLLKCVREMDVVTRYAGDEFIAILPEADKNEAHPVALRILDEMKSHTFINPKTSMTYGVGVSIGISTYPNDGENATDLINTADRGLYTAKHEGRNTVRFGDRLPDPPVASVTFDGKIPRFIGRHQELKLLQNVFRDANDSVLRVVTVAGEAGVGKTRLIQEFFNAASKEAAIYLKGACFDVKIPMPYQPIREALVGFISQDEYYAYSILRSLPVAAKIEILKVIPALDVKRMGIKSDMTLEPIQDEYRLFDGVYQVLKKISERGLVVLFLDDMHWADVASLELFSYLVRNARNDRILICMTYRPEEILDGNVEKGPMASILHKLSRVHKFDKIVLSPLSKEHLKEILQSVFKGYNLSPELVDLFFNETEGNPFFVEELLKSFIENNHLEYHGKNIVLKSPETIDLPNSIRDLVQERIDKLPEELQELLVIAAAIGQEFSLKLLSLITEKNEGHIQDILDIGMDAHIIEEGISSGEEKFSFTHCKIREVLYYSLRESKRERLHLKIAGAMERLYHYEIEKHYEDLAQQYYFTRNKEKAFAYMFGCAQKAESSYAAHEAISYFSKTEKLYQEFEQALQARYRTDYVLIALSLGRLNSIISEYDTALHWLEIAQKSDDSSYQPYLLLGEVYVKKGDYETALEYLKIAFDKTKDSSHLANIETNISFVYFRVGNLNDSEHFARKAIKRLEDKTVSLVTAEGYKNLGTVYFAKNEFDSAITHYQKSLEISLELNDKRAIANSYNNLGSVYYRKRDYEKSLKHLENCLVIREEIGDKSGIVYSYNNIGNIYFNKAEYPNAEKYYRQCLEISTEIGEQSAITASYNNLGNVYLAREQFEQAREHYETSLEISKKIGEKAGIGRALSGLGNVCFNKNDYHKAEEYFTACFDIRGEIGDLSGMAFTSISLAFSAISLGDFHKAEEYFLRGSKIKEAINDVEGKLTILDQLIRLNLFTGKMESAESILVPCLKIAQESGVDEIVAEIWGLYALYYIALDQQKLAKKAVETMQSLAATTKCSIPVATFISFVKARYALYTGQYKKALPLLESALKYRRIKSSDLEYGHIMLDYVDALIHLARITEAEEKLEIAGTFFERLNIPHLDKRIEQLREYIKKTDITPIKE